MATTPPGNNSIPIAQLHPDQDVSGKSILGVVTLLWPYSKSRRTFSLLLVEPDFRLRRQNGQVRVHLQGPSARILASSGVQSGDQIVLNLEGVNWLRDESTRESSARGIEWQLQFGECLSLQLLRENHEPVFLDAEHQDLSPQASSPTPLQSPRSPAPVGTANIGARLPQTWASPAFLKRKASGLQPLLGSVYDPLEYENEYREFSPSKKTKFGRKSGEWRFTDRSPSPVATSEPVHDNGFDISLRTITPGMGTDKPVDLPPTQQRNVDSVPREEPPGAADATPYDNIETAISIDSDVGRKRSPYDIDDRDEISKASSSVGNSSPEPDNFLETKKPRTAIQDTYDDETWSSSSTTADFKTRTPRANSYSEEHGPLGTSSPSNNVQPSSPEQGSQSTTKSSRSVISSPHRRQGSGDIASLPDSNIDSDDANIDKSVEEPFSKRAYVPSESVASSIRASEEHELSGVLSSSPAQGEDQNEQTHVIPMSQPSEDAPNYLASDANITTEKMDDGSQPSVPNDATITHQSVDDAVTGSQPKSPPKTYGPIGLIKDVSLSSMEDKGGYTQGQEKRSGRGTSDTPGKDKDDNIIGRMFEGLERQPSASRHLPEDQTLNGLQQNVASEDEGDDNDDEDKTYGSETWAPNQRTESAGLLNMELVGNEQETAGDPNVEGYPMADNRPDSPEDESRSDDVEIIDLDEYEPNIGGEEDEDLAHSENADYWSQEELPRNEDEGTVEPDSEQDIQSEEGAESDVEDDDEISDEEDLRRTNRGLGETTDDEESNLYDHSSLGPNTMQSLRENLNSRPETKISTVEIIDLDSEEEDELATYAVNVTQVSPKWLDGPVTDEGPREASSLSFDHAEPIHDIEISRQAQAQQPDIGIGVSREAQYQPSPKLSTPLERVVHDTYSEDAALSDAEDSTAPSITQANAAVRPLTWSTKHLPDSEASAEETAILPSQSTSGQRGLPNEDSQNVPHAGDPASPVYSLGYWEEGSNCEGRRGLEQGEASTRLSLEFPGQDGSPASPSASLVDQIKTTTLLHGQTPGSSEPAEDDEFPRSQVTLRTYSDGNDEEVVKEYSLEALRDEFTQQSQLPTPNDTQTHKITREPSTPHSISHEEQNTLPTPSLTQKTSDLVPPATLALPRKTSLIEKLKEMRSNSARKRQSNSANNVPTAASPWFGTSKSSQIAPSSDHESTAGVDEETGLDGDVSSDVEQSEVNSQPSLPKQRAQSPTLDSGIARLPSSSPPPPPEPKAGFRTSLSYFAPLSTLRAHYNATTSVLALVIASTSVARATAGPKDYHMTLHITDPSSASPPSVTSARIFRPSKFPFPEARQGDAVLLRNFRVVSYRKQLGLLSTESSAWAVFRRGEEPQIKGPPVEFGAEERGFARGHWDWWGTVPQQDYVDAVPSGTPDKKGRDLGRGKGRSSLVRHELRDGTTYVDRPKVADNDMHELRDGTMWSDSKP